MKRCDVAPRCIYHTPSCVSPDLFLIQPCRSQGKIRLVIGVIFRQGPTDLVNDIFVFSCLFHVDGIYIFVYSRDQNYVLEGSTMRLVLYTIPVLAGDEEATKGTGMNLAR